MNVRTALILFVAVIVGCSGASPSPAAQPSTSSPASNAPTALESRAPSSSSAFSLDYVQATPLGRLTGDKAVVVRHGNDDGHGVREIVVVDLAGGPIHVALRYRYRLRPAELVYADAGPVSLARQLSPDGKRVVLDDAYLPPEPSSAKRNDPGQPLLIADLETGKLTVLSIPGIATDSVDPAWAPSGDIIAFARRPIGAPRPGDDGVWTVRTDGSELLRLTDGDRSGYSYVFGWTADGAGVAFGVGGLGLDHLDYRIVDVSTRSVKRLDGYVESISPGAWRNATPAFAGAFTDDPAIFSAGHFGGATRIVVVDATGASPRTVLTEPLDQYGRPRLLNVRWHPSADRLLVEVRDPGQNSVRIIDLATGTVTAVGRGRAFRPEWAPSGTELVCLVSSPPTAPISVTIGPLDRACQQDLLQGTFDWSVLDLATRRYR